MWQAWAKKDKELNRQYNRGNVRIDCYAHEIEKEKNDIRMKQLKGMQSISVIMDTFLKALLDFSKESSEKKRNYFLKSLSLMLNEYTGESMKKKQQKYHQLREEVSSSKYSEVTEQKRIDFLKIQQEILKTSFGIENLFREIGQIYEAAHNCKEHRSYCSKLSDIVADLVIDGYPLELMDGDAAHVPLLWIKAVLLDVIKKIGDHKIFVLSVLGIQSSGKSTLLNATFGLQFKVSAGRCTSGAYMQLIQLDSILESHTGCRYLIVVDTEGLRAPDLNDTIKYKHDNELATFVIGLASTTLINIKGEVPGDINDILQTSVHAFLRMSEVKNYRSCQFVHQNCSSSLKSDVRHTQFTQKLDIFTKEAAETERCSSKYQHFNDVIKYDDIHDKHYFPGLWKGDPPIAPVNEGYSEKAQSLKFHIINKLCEKSSLKHNTLKSGLQSHNISLFIESIFDLWKALLNENFVFSFKNTLEVKTYNTLLKNYNQLEWKFQESMIEWIQAASNEINGCKVPILSDMVLNRKKNLQSHVRNTHEELKKEMEETFKGNYHEILIQWKQKLELKLKTLAGQLEKDAFEHCLNLVKSKKEISNFISRKNIIVDRIKQKVRENIHELRWHMSKLEHTLTNKPTGSHQLDTVYAKDLFSNVMLKRYWYAGIREESLYQILKLKLKGRGKVLKKDLSIVLYDILSLEEVKQTQQVPLPEKLLKRNFNRIWVDIISEISYSEPETSTMVSVEVENVLANFTETKGWHGLLVTKLTECPLEEWTDIEKTDIDKTDTNMFESFLKCCKNMLTGNVFHDESDKRAKDVEIEILTKANDKLKEIVKRESNFSAPYVRELLHCVDESISNCSPFPNKDSILTKDFQLELCIKVCSTSIPEFKKMAENFEKQHDPKVHLESNEKDPLFAMYKYEYKQTEAEESIADTVCAYLYKPISDQIKQMLGTKMLSKMKKSKQYLVDKASLKVKILSDLLHQPNFEKYMVYLTDIQSSFSSHIIKYTIDFCDEILPDNNLTELQCTACDEANKLVDKISTIFISTFIPEDDLKKLLADFCDNQDLHCLIQFDFGADTLLCGFDSIKKINLANFQRSVLKQLAKLKVRMMNSFSTIKCEQAIQDWSHQPDKLLKSLMGCKEPCPFCGEQCDIMDVDHLGEQPHRTEIHRLDCLKGWRLRDSKEMHTECCPAMISGNTKFWISDKTYECKNYKEVYPDWSITPNLTSKHALYWRWFVTKYRQELAEYYKAKPADIPDYWIEYSEEATLEDLNTVYIP